MNMSRELKIGHNNATCICASTDTGTGTVAVVGKECLAWLRPPRRPSYADTSLHYILTTTLIEFGLLLAIFSPSLYVLYQHKMVQSNNIAVTPLRLLQVAVHFALAFITGVNTFWYQQKSALLDLLGSSCCSAHGFPSVSFLSTPLHLDLLPLV